MYPMGNISVKLGLEQLVSSNPRPHQNLIHFDLSKLAKRPLLGRHRIRTGYLVRLVRGVC